MSQEIKGPGTMKGKVLLIEDDEFLESMIFKKLKDAGFLVDNASDGEVGLRKAKEEKPDLVLLDVVLPGMNGFEVIKQLKKDSDTASIPVIFLTNLAQKDEIEKGFALGADDYLVKAYVTPNEIMEKVKKIFLS